MPKNVDIALDNVSLRYPGSHALALQSVNLSIAHGEHVAIIGPSGSGKSTLINALLRFWPLESGEIRYNGILASGIHSDDLRSQFAVASQHSTLFNSTIERNLLMANRDASHEEVVAACKLAHIHDFIETLPDGYDTYIGEAGHKLSGGQSRRLSVARALLKPASVLILDEPGEGLDSVTEQAMLESILQNVTDKTIILITHHDIGLKNMHQLIRLQHGNIVKY